MNNKPEIQELSEFLSEYTTCLMAVGVQTSRIARNSARIAQAFGYTTDMTIFQKTIIMSLKSDETNETFSSVNKIKPMSLNFEVNSMLSKLSWETYDEHLSLDEIKKRFDEILKKPRISKWIVLPLVAVGNACFCRIFSGDMIAMLVVFAATLIGFWVRQLMFDKHINHLFVFIFSSFIASFVAALSKIYHLGTTPDIAIATSVLYLIPGVPLINGITDIIDGHVLAGVSRLINALLLIICIAIGLSLSFLLLGLKSF